MKIIVVSVNARFIHTNLAVRYLSSMIEDDHTVLVKEFTINHHCHEILAHIFRENAEAVAFSCYIWNIEMILKVVSSLKKVSPDTVIILGGPEVSYDPDQIMKANDAIDFIISGYGETSFAALIETLESNSDYTHIPHLSYRIRGNVYSNSATLKECSSFVTGAYKEFHELIKGQIYYYESSRGCPYHCQFCLSGNDSGLETIPLDRVFHDLQTFLKQEVRQVKFVDRTFNTNPQRTLEIWQFLKDHDNGITNFHFEISASALTNDMIFFLGSVPEGLFQFEIGVQTTTQESLASIQRASNQETDFSKIKKLQQLGSIHLHVDLIAGLPHEDFFSFRKSFNEVFRLNADMLQLGFLKLLKGSGLRDKVLEYEFVFQDHPPYEILSNHVITYGELLALKGIEEVLERYWNSGKYNNTIRLTLIQLDLEPFAFFQGFAEYWEVRNPPLLKVNQWSMLDYLRDYLATLLPENTAFIDAVIGFDLAASGQHREMAKSMVPQGAPDTKGRLHELLHDQRFLDTYFPDLHDQPAKKILPYVYAMSMPKGFYLNKTGNLAYDLNFDIEPMMVFIYPRKNPHRVQNTIIIHAREEVQ